MDCSILFAMGMWTGYWIFYATLPVHKISWRQHHPPVSILLDCFSSNIVWSVIQYPWDVTDLKALKWPYESHHLVQIMLYMGFPCLIHTIDLQNAVVDCKSDDDSAHHSWASVYKANLEHKTGLDYLRIQPWPRTSRAILEILSWFNHLKTHMELKKTTKLYNF
jgi:hypothetical protein